jgi:hypothetical protein
VTSKVIKPNSFDFRHTCCSVITRSELLFTSVIIDTDSSLISSDSRVDVVVCSSELVIRYGCNGDRDGLWTI